MKRIFYSLLIGLSLFASPVFSNYFSEIFIVSKKEVTVYTTRTGSKYHKNGCRYLRKSAYQTTKKAAIANGFGACSICKP
ncbi:hypothetical protein [Pedobacter sp.]|uniref:hypothetical protein n=1 Tax=Pedobacter sp. TaxID=1411316 RepID=UPI003D7F40AF